MAIKTIRRYGFYIMLGVVLFYTGCAGSPSVRNTAPDTAETSPSSEEKGYTPSGTGTALAVPARPAGALAFADSAVLADVETGTPASLKNAADKIQRTPASDETSKILLAVAGGIFDITYPLEKRTWDIPAVSRANPYTGAIESARLGIYETSTGKDDFLSLTLPSLVLLTAPSISNFYADAEEALNNALKLNERSPLALYLLGVLHQRQKRIPEAGELFRRAWELDASCYPAGAALVSILALNGKPEEGYVIARQLLDAYPQNMDFLRLCAETTLSAKNWQLADQYVSMVLQKDPANTAFLLFRIRILVENGEYLKASSLLDVYSKTEKTSREYLLLRTRIQKEWNKNLSSAAATIQEALRLYPDDIEVLLAAADIAILTGQKMGTMTGSDLVGRALKSHPDNPQALFLAVTSAIQRKDWNTAVSLGKKLMSVSPGTASSMLYIRACLGGGHTAEALVLAKQLYSENLQNEDVVQTYIETLIAAGDSAGASALIRDKLSSASSRFKSILYYERSRIAAGEEQQLSDLRASLNANPRNQAALFALYTFYFNKKDYRKAQYYLKQVVAMNPADSSLLKLQSDIDLLLAQ